MKELPFFKLTDFQLIWENESCKQSIIDKIENNGFLNYVKNMDISNGNDTILDDFKYYDTDDLNRVLQTQNLLKVIHINARMLSKNRGKIIGFLGSLDTQPNIIMLSEIGKEGYHFPQSTNFKWRCCDAI